MVEQDRQKQYRQTLKVIVRDRDDFLKWVYEIRRELQRFHDLTPTYYNEREAITKALFNLYSLESLLMNQKELEEGE